MTRASGTPALFDIDGEDVTPYRVARAGVESIA